MYLNWRYTKKIIFFIFSNSSTNSVPPFLFFKYYSYMIEPFVAYREKRFKLIPWGIYPLYFILMFSRDLFSLESFLNLIFLPITLFFFRLFDDFYCRDYDRSENKKYLDFVSRKDHKKMLDIFLVLQIVMVYFFQDLSMLIMFFFLITISFALYIYWKDDFKIEFVPLLKYPWVILAVNTNAPFGVALAFFVTILSHELLESRIGVKKSYLMYFVPLIFSFFYG